MSVAATTNLAVVAPGIAEALLATAFGVAAAIPAVVIYNVFARWIAVARCLVRCRGRGVAAREPRSRAPRGAGAVGAEGDAAARRRVSLRYRQIDEVLRASP